MNKKEVMAIFKERKAMLEGHFELSSGLHSAKYLQAALVLQYPWLATRLCTYLAQFFMNKGAQAVISPALGGIVVGQKVAEVLKARAIFAERDKGKFTLRRGFRINREEKVLVVEDVITTGGSVKELIKLIEESEGVVVGVGCLINRSCNKIAFITKRKIKIRPKSLISLKIKTFSQARCPLCKKGMSLMKPGSKSIGQPK
ncbi:MAG: orotate phosphoribosyltransferase [bacterium]